MAGNWIEDILAAISALGIGAWIQTWYKRRYPTKHESIDFVKTYTDAQIVNLNFTQHIEKLVEQKTEVLREVLIQREVEHKAQVDLYLNKISEVEHELKQERLIKEQYLKDLQRALFKVSELEKETETMKIRIGELESINKTNSETQSSSNIKS